MPELKLGNHWLIFPNFQNCAGCEKYLKDKKHISLQSPWIYARIFCPWTSSQFPKAHRFPQTTTTENSVRFSEQISNVRGQISDNIFAPNGGYCLCNIIVPVNAALCCKLLNWRKSAAHLWQKLPDRCTSCLLSGDKPCWNPSVRRLPQCNPATQNIRNALLWNRACYSINTSYLDKLDAEAKMKFATLVTFAAFVFENK